jgi:tetratricopeptide (TPR) repeat protein
MDREAEWAKGKPVEADLTSVLAATALYRGKLNEAESLYRRGVEMFKAQGRAENASQALINLAFYQAVFGKCQPARESAKASLALARGKFSLANAGLVAAMCGDESQAQTIADNLTTAFPSSTEIVGVGVPLLRSEIERSRGNVDQAIQISESIRRYDMGLLSACVNNYLRGTLYLQQRRGNEAASEFKRVLDLPGIDPHSALHVLAYLGLARAAAINGDTAAARKSFQDFFAIWKDADSDLPVLVKAKKEYDQLK